MFPCLGCCVWCRVGTHDEPIRYGYIPHPRKTIPRLLGKLARGLNGGNSFRQRHRPGQAIVGDGVLPLLRLGLDAKPLIRHIIGGQLSVVLEDNRR